MDVSAPHFSKQGSYSLNPGAGMIEWAETNGAEALADYLFDGNAGLKLDLK